MVPPATFTSYYGRPVVKAVTVGDDIPAYLFLGGLAAGSSLLAAGADLSESAGRCDASRASARSPGQPPALSRSSTTWDGRSDS